MKKQNLLIFIFMALALSLTFSSKSNAAMLSVSKNKVQNGSTLRIDLYFYYGKAKPKWSVSNKKAKIVSKGKKWCKIKAKKTGTVYVKCKIGKKTYKKKITIKDKSKVTYNNYLDIEQGMHLEDVEDIIGHYSEIYRSESHTYAEYNEYHTWYLEDGPGSMWEDYLYMEQVEYKWVNPWTYKTVYCTFNDGVLVKKEWH